MKFQELTRFFYITSKLDLVICKSFNENKIKISIKRCGACLPELLQHLWTQANHCDADISEIREHTSVLH
jgi:hypothetical protein